MEFRNLEIHYLEEEPDGVRVVDLKGSSVHALVFPRNEFNKARDVAKLFSFPEHAVYFLIGDKEDEDLPVMYAGQTKDGMRRFWDHDRKKPFWNLAILFISMGNNFELGDIDALEKKAIQAIDESNRYASDNVVHRNSKGGKKDVLRPLYNSGDIRRYFDDIKFIMHALGWSLEPSEKSMSVHSAGVWHTTRNGVEAYMKLVNGKSEIQRGSVVDMSRPITRNETLQALRDKLVGEGEITKDANGAWRLRKILTLGSPSSSALFVLSGPSANGLTEWKNAEGKDIKSVRGQSL